MMDQKGNVIVSDWIPISKRETQEINGRPIFHYDHLKQCGPDPIVKVVDPGHYEKIQKMAVEPVITKEESPKKSMLGSIGFGGKEGKPKKEKKVKEKKVKNAGGSGNDDDNDDSSVR